MENFSEIRNKFTEKLKILEDELWKSWTKATNSKDLATLDKIRIAIERKKNVEAEIIEMFDDLESTGASVQGFRQPLSYIPSRTKGKAGKTYPNKIRIGDFEQPIRFLNQIPVIIANWILEQGKNLPEIQNFVHRQNDGFMASAAVKKLKNGWYIEVGDSKETLIVKGRKLLDQTGFSSIGFTVEMHNGQIIRG